MEQTDGELLKRFAASRDAGAFEELVRRHGPMVLAVCRRILHNRADAEDAFQAVFFVLARKAGSIRDREVIAHWLYRVAGNAARRLRARVSRRQDREESMDLLTIPGMTAAQVADVLSPVVDEEVDRLPRKFREVLVLCCLEGKSYAEAALLLRCSEGAVRGRLARGRDYLRERLARRGLTSSPATFATALPLALGMASLPVALAPATTKAAVLFASGGGTGAAGPAALLAKTLLASMVAAKVKLVAAVGFLVSLLSVSSVVLHDSRPPAVPDASAALTDASALEAHSAKGRQGKVASFDPKTRQLTLDDHDETVTFTLPVDVSVLTDKKPGTTADLKPGVMASVAMERGQVVLVRVSVPMASGVH